MKGSIVLTRALALMTILALPACQSSPQGTALDRLKRPAAEHAQSLTGEDTALMRETGLSLLAKLEALAGW